MLERPEVPVEESLPATTRFWPAGWWRIVETRVGIVPLPVYLLLLALLAGFVSSGRLAGDISTVIAVLVVGGFSCAELGKRLPLFRHIGAAAIFATFIPSALAFHHVLPQNVIDVTTSFTKSTDFLYLFISAIIVGSIFSMDREVLVRGFLKIFVPLALGSIAAIVIGTATGTLLGLGFQHTLFFIVLPIMAGGVGEGAIPLSVGYAQVLHLDQGELFAQILPPVMLGSLTAILLAGSLNFLGKRRPHWTGDGRLQPSTNDAPELAAPENAGTSDVTHIAAAGITAVALYLSGVMCQRICGLPAPVGMLFAAVALSGPEVVTSLLITTSLPAMSWTPVAPPLMVPPTTRSEATGLGLRRCIRSGSARRSGMKRNSRDANRRGRECGRRVDACTERHRRRQWRRATPARESPDPCQ